MTISSDQINNLLAYARERHGAPCRVEIFETEWPEMWENDEPPLDCAIYLRDFVSPMGGRGCYEVERILI